MKSVFQRRYRSNLVILVVSAAMMLSGGFLVTFPEGVAVNADNAFVGTPLFAVAVILFGTGGVMLYLVKGMVKNVSQRRLLGLLAIAPLVLVLGISTASGSESSLAFLVPAIIFSAISIWMDEPHLREADSALLPLFAGSVAILFGVMTYLPFPWKSLGFPYGWALAVPSLAAGGACIYAWLSPRTSERTKAVTLFTTGLLFAVVACIAAVTVNRYILAIFYAPLAAVALGFPFLKQFRLGAPLMEDLTEENTVLLRFLGITETVAWSVYLFSYIYFYINIPLQRPGLFPLFVLAFILFVYEYRIRPVKKLARMGNYARTSIMNAVMLSIVSHFTGGLESPYNVFFVFVLLSGMVLPDPRAVLLRLGYFIVYFLFEATYLILVRGYLAIPIEAFFVDFTLVSITGLYAYQMARRRQEVDADIHSSNQELTKVIERERETRMVISEQATELVEARAELDAVLESVADGIIAVDTDKRVHFMNEAASALLGIGEKEAVGKRVAEVFRVRAEGEPLTIDKMVDDVMRPGGRRSDEAGSRSPERNIVPLPQDAHLPGERSSRYLEGAVIGLPSAGQASGAVITFRDVTYRREIDQLKTDFISVAAHQLRTPLSSIRWYLELLNDPEEGKLNKHQGMFARNAYISTKRMLALINGLLAVTRVEAGRVPIKPGPTDLKVMTRNVIDEIKAGAEEKNVDIHLRVDGKMTVIPLDPDLSREVFVNLLHNAIRYSPEGGEVLVRIEARNEELLWSVTDNGIGIPEEARNRIFEKFYRAPNAVLAESEGTGLGLYLAKFITGLWGGRIWFESEEGKGTTFYVTVPYEGMEPRAGEISLHA